MKKLKKLYYLDKDSTSKKIFLFTSLTIIVTLLIFIILIYTRIKSIYIDNAKDSTQQNVNLISQSLGNYINNIEDAMLLATIDNDLQGNITKYNNEKIEMWEIEKSISQYIHQTVNTNRAILGSGIYLNDGNILNISQFINNDIEDLMEGLLNDGAYEAFEWYGTFELKQFNGVTKNIFLIEKKIIGLNNAATLGYMYMFVDEQAMAEIYSSSIHQDTNFLIVNQQNKIISSKQKDLFGKDYSEALEISSENIKGQETQGQDLQNQEMRDRKIQDKQLQMIDGVQSFQTENSIQDKNWKIVTVTPMTSLMESSKELFTILAVFTFVTMCIGVILSSKISKIIAKPISDLVNTITKITLGDRNLRAEDTNNKEINILNHSFNKLMDTNDALLFEVYEKHKILRNYELLVLQEQIKPHFLYNSLSTINSLIKLDMNLEAIDSVTNLAKFYRISLSDGNDIITIKEEVQMLQSYIIIQQYRFKDLIEFEMDIEDCVFSEKIPKLSLQPLIENAIIHGTRPNKPKTKIILTGKRRNDNILLSVKDFGMGIDKDVLQKVLSDINKRNTSNFGLSCVNQRIKIIHGDEYGIEIMSEKDVFTEVKLVFPYNGE